MEPRFDLGADDIPDLVVGAGPGSGEARVFSGADLAVLAAAPPFGPGFTGGVRVAAGDVDGDGVADVVAAMASGGGRVTAFSGASFSLLADFEPYGAGFGGGVSVALGDTNADGHADLIVAPAAGAGPVRVYSGANGAVLLSGTPFGGETGGLNVAAGDVNGDGRADIVVAQARGNVVAVFSGADLSVLGSGLPYGPAFAGGISVAAGDLNADGRAEVITAPASGRGPVQAFDLGALALVSSGDPFGPDFDRGIQVASSDIDADGHDEIIVGSGPGAGPRVRVFSGADQHLIADFFAFAPTFPGGVHLAVPRRSGIRITSPNQATFTAGVSGTFAIRTAGAPPGSVITLAGDLPTGITFTDNTDGTATLSGTPAAGTGGSYDLTVTAGAGAPRPAIRALTVRVEESPAITSGASTTFRVGELGTFQVTSSGFPAPDLTVSGALPAGVTFTDLDNGQATLSGTPAVDTGGSYSLTITASNDIGAAATQTFTLIVESGPIFTSANAATFIVGTVNRFDITTAGEPAVTSITRTGTLPAGLVYTDNGDGTASVSGAAAPGSGGTYPQTLTAANGVGAPATQVLTIAIQQAPEITSAAATTFVAGSAGSFTITTVGSPAPAISATGALPAGVTLVDNANGTATLSGTAAAGGSFPVTITASNGVGAAAVQSFVLTVHQAPAITSAPTVAFNVGAASSFVVTATGVPLPTLSATGGLPTGVTFADSGNGTATLAGTPASGTAGTYPLTITASNGVGTAAVQDFSLIVRSSPAITSASAATFIVGTAGSFAVTATGSPAPTLSASGALPAGVTFNSASGELAGTPTQTGSFAGIQFTAANGVPPDAVQDFTLTVSCPAIIVSPPTLPDGAYNSPYGPIPFTSTGSTGSVLTWTATGLPAGLAIGSTSGVVSGVAVTTAANAAVTITVTDEFGCTGARSTTMSVRPIAVDDSFASGVGNTQYVVGGAVPATPHVYVAGSVLAGDAGPGPLTAALTTAPANGTATLAPDGTFVYTPNLGFAGPIDVFGYTLTDANGVTDTATVTIGLGGVVWYVNNAGGNGDGRSHNPFNTLAAAGPASLPGDAIFVHAGVGPTPGSLVLKTGQTLWGQGAPFVRNALVIPAAGRPVLGGTVTLASSATVSSVAFNTGSLPAIVDPAVAISGAAIVNGVAVTTTGAAAVTLSDASGSFTFESISVTGAASAIQLSNLAGSFAVTGTGAPGSGGTIQNTFMDAIRLANTSGPVSLASMIIQDIGDMIGAIDTVSGHQAIRGENVTGGLSLTNVTMRRLSDHAILGSSFASPGSPTTWNGLTIANSTIEDSNRFHVVGLGDGGNEAMVRVLGLRGTVSVTGSTLQRGNKPLDLVVTGGALTMTVTSSSFQAYKETIVGGLQPTVGQQCIDVRVQGTATASVTIGDRTNPGLGNQFTNCRVGSVRVFHDTAATGAVEAVVARNTFTVNDHSSPAGFDFFFPQGGVLAGSQAAPSATMNVLALANTFTEVTNASGGVGQLTLTAEGGTFQARVDGNTFIRPGNAPWFIRAAENQQGRIELRNNRVVGGFFDCPDPSCGGGYNAPGIRAIADVQRNGRLDLTIDGDVFARHDIAFDPGNTVEIQSNNVGLPGVVCAALRNNQSPDGYALEQSAGTFNLYRWASAATGTCTAGAPGPCATVLSQNSNTGGAGDPLATPPALSVSGTVTLTGAACGLPTGSIFF